MELTAILNRFEYCGKEKGNLLTRVYKLLPEYFNLHIEDVVLINLDIMDQMKQELIEINDDVTEYDEEPIFHHLSSKKIDWFHKKLYTSRNMRDTTAKDIELGTGVNIQKELDSSNHISFKSLLDKKINISIFSKSGIIVEPHHYKSKKNVYIKEKECVGIGFEYTSSDEIQTYFLLIPDSEYIYIAHEDKVFMTSTVDKVKRSDIIVGYNT